jgi:signal transduction histidine kinase/CheY-like chemotaxis protein
MFPPARPQPSRGAPRMPIDAPVDARLTPTEAAAEKARHRRELFVRRAPWLRLLGLEIIVAAVWLHNDLILGTHDPATFTWLWAGVTAYVFVVWAALARWYDGTRRLWMPDVATALDTVVVAVCVYASGGDRSWLFFLLAVRVADQVAMGARRVVLFSHLNVACYLAVLAWVRWVDGRAVAWEAEAVKVFIVYGTQVYFSVAARAADRLRERRDAAVGLARDLIAQLEEKAAQLEAERRRAEEASRAKSEFLSRMSHELRTPLNAILGFAQLQELEGGGGDREGVEQILKAGRHLLSLIDEVLDISRIESGRMAMSIEPVPVQEVVAEVLALVRPLASQRGVRVPAALDVGRDRHVRADRRRLEQVLLNLASNAIKYNRPGGEVRLSFQDCGDGRVCLAVTDTGPGIAAEKMDRLFTPFERLGAEDGEVEGVGIGLALSRGLMEAMGGTLTATSTPGTGSTFVAALPAAESPLAAAEAAGHAPAVDGAGPAIHPSDERLVLYVEDNASNVKLVERVLAQRAGLRLLTAFQGRLGLELARQHRPAVVLLDLHLPDIGGDEVLRLLRDDPETRGIPVVVISADASAGQIERMLAGGARAYLTKPLDVRQFLGVLDEALQEAAA